jgi:phage-related protein
MFKGRSCNLDFACCRDGSQPAKEFVDGLEVKDRTKFEALLRQLSDTGTLWNKQKFKKLQGDSGIWELRAGDYRLFCFKSGRTWFLTNGFRKDTNRTPPQQVKLAIRVMNEHLGSK